MKKIFSLIFVSLCTLSLSARIPAGSTIYLDVSQAWCCKATYAVCCSELNDAYFIMRPVQGYDGLYSYTTSQSLQDNIRFGYSNQTITRDGLGWNNFTTREVTGYSTARPYYIVTSDNGQGSWAAASATTGATTLDSVVVSTPTTCIDSTYDVIVSIYFTGAPCSIQLNGDMWATAPYRTTNIAHPTVVKLNGIKEEAGANHYVVATIYSDKNFATEIGSKQISYQAPEIECEMEYNLGDQCTNEALTLSSDAEGDVYMWSTGESTPTIQVTPTLGEQTYTVEVYGSVLHPAENLMFNGDFETEVTGSTPPPGFTSSYRYVKMFNPHEYYTLDNHYRDNLYAITQNANYFWHEFYSIPPHGGIYYAIFDANKEGYAWRATTEQNPLLKVQKDSIYLFSYWAVYPNNDPDKNPAILQFEIKYRDANGTMHTQLLGSQYKLGQEEELHGWYQRTVTWKAPISSDYIEIAVKDVNNTTDYIGNDFCLDDIMFQKASITNLVLSRREIFHINGIDCGEPEPEPECTDNWLRAKWSDVIFVDNSAGEFVRYEWYKNDLKIEGATEQYYRAGQNLNQSNDTYFAKMWKADGTLVVSCPKHFSEISRSRDEYPAPLPAQVVGRRIQIIGAHFRIVETIYEDGHVDVEKEVY